MLKAGASICILKVFIELKVGANNLLRVSVVSICSLKALMAGVSERIAVARIVWPTFSKALSKLLFWDSVLISTSFQF